MGPGIQQAFYKHQDDNEQMSENQLILNLQMANFLSSLEKLQAHGIFLLLCSAVQIHSWSTKASGKNGWRESRGRKLSDLENMTYQERN